MYPDLDRIERDVKERERLENVKEYQKKFFNKITKGKYEGGRVR